MEEACQRVLRECDIVATAIHAGGALSVDDMSNSLQGVGGQGGVGVGEDGEKAGFDGGEGDSERKGHSNSNNSNSVRVDNDSGDNSNALNANSSSSSSSSGNRGAALTFEDFTASTQGTFAPSGRTYIIVFQEAPSQHIISSYYNSSIFHNKM